jgi:hypothetical protein
VMATAGLAGLNLSSSQLMRMILMHSPAGCKVGRRN